MPAVFAAVAAAWKAYGAWAAANTFIAGVIKAVVVAAAAYGAGTLLAKTPGKPSIKTSERHHMIRSAVESHKIIYGQTLTSGPLIYAGTTDGANYMHMVIALAGHECQEIGDVYFNDKLSTAYDAAYYRINKHLGSADQAADTNLVAEVAEWGTNHRLRGICYLYVRLKYSTTVWPLGLPNIKAVVKGKKVFDPRTGTTAWSDNWALCLRDYIVSDYGLGCDSDEINEASFIAAANISDENEATPTGTQKRYTCNGVVNTGEKITDNIEGLVTAGGGAWSYVQGECRIYAGAYSSPVMALNESQLRDELKVRAKPPKKELFNAVRGVYISPENVYQSTDFPLVKNATYAGQDGDEIVRDIELPFTDDPIEAQRLAKIMLERARQGIVVDFQANFAALKLSPWDNVTLTVSRMGWENKVFKVLSWAVPNGGGVDLTLQEEASAAYAWNGGEATTVDPAPDTNLRGADFVYPPTALTMQSGDSAILTASDGTLINRILASWTPPLDAFVVRYDVDYQLSGETTWTSTQAIGTSFYLSPVQDGARYNFRVRAVNSLGCVSVWLAESNHAVVGKTEAPPTVDTFLVGRMADGTRQFTWTLASRVPDLAGYHIRYKLGTSSTWDDMYPLHDGLLTASPHETNQLAAGSYVFAIVAVDTSGNVSPASYISTDLADPRIGGVVASAYPHSSGWPGTKTSCYVDKNSFLVATDQATWAALSSITWATWKQWATNPRSPISYEHPTIDIGAVIIFNPLISALVVGTATVEVNTSIDGSTWSGWGVPARVTARYAKIRCSVAGSYPLLKTLNILLSAETLTEEINDLDTSTLTGDNRIGVGDIRLPLQKDYSVVSQVMVALQGVGAGWTWVIVDKTVAIGPRLKIYNASGTLADATIDVFIRGI